jgi:hypothetical protein
VILLLLSSPVYAGGIPEPYDKMAHFGINFTLVSGMGLISKHSGNNIKDSIILPVLFATTLSLGKELTDDKFGWDDLAADALGMTLGAYMVYRF